MTVAVGPTYQAFLPAWAESIAALNTQPEQVTVVSDDLAPTYAAQLSEILNQWQLITSTKTWTHHPQVLVNDGIKATDTDWICKLDVDDRIYPHAFDRLHNTACDVWMFGIRHGDLLLHPPAAKAEDILRSPHNLVFSGSPFRKWLTGGAGFRDMIYEDWMFWIDCAKQNARFCHSGTIDYEYVTHGENISSRVDDAYWQAVVRGLR